MRDHWGMKPIESEEEYQSLVKECEGYFEVNPVPGSPEAIRFVELIDAISKYEDEHHPIEDEEPRAVALVEFQVRGIKCDNPSCDFIDPTVEVEEFPAWVNRLCPNCGENLLTEGDYDNVTRMLSFTNLINELAVNGALGFAQPDENGNFEPLALEIDHNGVPNIIRLSGS
jgi:hypothetical protein